MTSPASETPLFAATLHPHRSLSRGGFVTMMILLGVLILSSAIMFLAVGAWPVVFFLAVDIVIIFLAFQINYRSGRAFEEVTVTADELIIRHVSPWGHETVRRLHPVWTTLKTAYDAEEERVLAIKLESKGEQLSVGGFMNPDDKESFANALGEALAKAKRGQVPR